MTLNLKDIENNINCQNIIKSIEEAYKGHIRFETAFRYPDGSQIDVFLKKESQKNKLLLTDFGNTIGSLLDLQLKPFASSNRKKYSEDILKTLELQLIGSCIEKKVTSLKEIESGIISVAQGCIRFSDLLFTRRLSNQSTFSDTMEDFLSESSLEYELNQELGDQNLSIKVDYLIHGQRNDSAILNLSTGNTGTAKTISNEILRKWIDMQRLGRNHNRVTVFDDRYDVYKKEDLDRLGNFSTVIPFSDKNSILAIVA